MISRYGGTDDGNTTYADIASKNSGTYTYSAAGINGAAATGAGSGTLDASVVIDFAAKTITQNVSGTVALGTNSSRSFDSISQTQSYTSSSSEIANYQNVTINSAGSAILDSTDFGSNTPQAGLSDNAGGYDNTGDNDYFLSTDFRASNITLGSNINNDPIAFAGHINVVVEDLDKDGNMENQLSFSRVAITPKKD